MPKATNKQEDTLAVSGVDHPSHYNQGSIECIDAMLAAYGAEEVRIFCKLNAFKYIWRAEKKGAAKSDIEKAKWYLDYSIKLYGEEDNKGRATDMD